MTTITSAAPAGAEQIPDAWVADVEIALPVHNEEAQLEAAVTRLREFLDDSFPLSARVVIVDNASTDGTLGIARRLAGSLPGVDALHLDRKGRGCALRAAWTRARSPVVAYMDVDLATDLAALLPLVAPLLSGHSEVATGTRLAPGSHVVRPASRELLSRGYNLLLRVALRTACTDAQCGFKALRREAALELLPLVADEEWFFDTELLVGAERRGLRVHEVPVDWTDDLDSRVDLARTVWRDLKGVGRLLRPTHRSLAPRTAPRARRVTGTTGSAPGDRTPASRDQFAADVLMRIAGASAPSLFVYLALFVLLEPWLGVWVANTAAAVATSAANAASSGLHIRTVTRGTVATTGSPLVLPGLLIGAGGGIGLAVTSASLATAHLLGVTALGGVVTFLGATWLLAALLRFAVLRTWVFPPRYGTNLATACSVSRGPTKQVAAR